jgi:hypothetical protein
MLAAINAIKGSAPISLMACLVNTTLMGVAVIGFDL